MNFRLQNLPTTTGGARIPGLEPTDEQESLRRGATNPAKVGFPSKNGGDFLMGFLLG